MAEQNYPESILLQNKSNYGICFPGGGIREVIFTCTYISSFKNIFDLTKIKYISSCSGSSIFMSMYACYENEYKFNKILKPYECSIDNLKIIENSTFENVISNIKLLPNFIDTIFEKKNKYCSKWIYIIKEIFFDKKYKYENNNSRPFNIINASLFYDDINGEYFPVEFTDFYCNLPIKINDKNGQYLYGGYIENDDIFFKDFELNPVIKCGLSSNFISALFEYSTKCKIDLFNYRIYNPITNNTNITNFVDGGIYDNISILSCLRRKIKNINVNIFTNVPITDKNFLNNSSESGYFKFFEGNDSSNKFTIFTKEIWNKIYNELLYKFTNGEPLIVLFSTEILKNEYLKIEPYGPINFLFHLNSNNKYWFNSLPIQTQKYILNKEPNFPYYNFLKFNFDSILTNLIGSLINYELENSIEYKLFYENL